MTKGVRQTVDYTVILDDTADPILYVGEAATGTPAAASLWRIKKIDLTNGALVTWADGNSNFDNVWDDRAGLTYS